LVNSICDIYINRKGETLKYTNAVPKLLKKIESLRFGKSAKTDWHLLKRGQTDEFTKSGQVDAEGGLIKIIPMNFSSNGTQINTKNSYFAVDVNGIRMLRVAYKQPEDDFYSNDDPKKFLTGLKDTNPVFYVRYFYEASNGVKTIDNFLYNRKFVYSGNNTDYFPNQIPSVNAGSVRTPLAWGNDDQRDRLAYFSNNLNMFFDQDGNMFDFFQQIYGEQDKYMNADISTVKIHPMIKKQANPGTAARYSNQILTQFPLGVLKDDGTLFTMLNIREKDGDKDIFTPSVHPGKVVISDKVTVLEIKYKTLYGNQTLKIRVKYEVNVQKANISGYTSKETWNDVTANVDWTNLGIPFKTISSNSTQTVFEQNVLTDYERKRKTCIIKNY